MSADTPTLADLAKLSDELSRIFSALQEDKWLGTKDIYFSLNAKAPSKQAESFFEGALLDLRSRGLVKMRRLPGGAKLWKARL